MATVYSTINFTVATEIRKSKAIAPFANAAGAEARARLLKHTHHGDHEITVAKARADEAFAYKGTDYMVSLVGPAAVAIEMGHFNAQTGRWTEGIHIMENLL